MELRTGVLEEHKLHDTTDASTASGVGHPLRQVSRQVRVGTTHRVRIASKIFKETTRGAGLDAAGAETHTLEFSTLLLRRRRRGISLALQNHRTINLRDVW